MIYKDLTRYTDGFFPPIDNILNVGWLDGSVDFPVGEFGGGRLDKLKEIVYGDNSFSARFRVARGFADCKICDEIATTKIHGSKKMIGASLLLIPSVKNGEYFASPSALIHYIEEHRYMPPSVFIESLDEVDLGMDFDAIKIVEELMA
ncbi:hypothetical protein QQM79_03455 [Marinobacteraceae bacterium S3BR75-40.1]